MQKGLNKVTLIGWVEADPEVRQTPNNRSVASFSLSVPHVWTSSQGEEREDIEWFNVVAWGTLADICRNLIYKDQQVYVEGRIQTRRWQDNQGRSHFRTEVVAKDIITLPNHKNE